MSGYRQSSYEPDTSVGRYGAPMRPYNRVQNIGLVLMLMGLAVDFVYFAGRLGWIRPMLGGPSLAIAFILPGVLLINSRRRPVPDLAPELAAARRRSLRITGALVMLVLGAAIAIALFTGA